MITKESIKYKYQYPVSKKKKNVTKVLKDINKYNFINALKFE